MNPVSTKKSATLMCGALLASIVVIPQSATADPDVILGVTSSNGDFSVQSFVHQFLGAPTIYGLSIYPLVVSSALSDRPGFDFELTWDLTGFGEGLRNTISLLPRHSALMPKLLSIRRTKPSTLSDQK